MTVRVALKLFLVASVLQGCAVASIVDGLLEEAEETQEESIVTENRVEVFQDLLKQGWKIQVYKNKVILIKETPEGFIINDVFSVLKEK